MTIQQAYQQFRFRGGMPSQQALHAARILIRWDELGEECVRMRAEPEEENYFDVYGKPEAYTDGNGRRVLKEQAYADLLKTLNTYGCWWTCSEWFDGVKWQLADSCGMHTGYKDVLDPFENWYVVDEMAAAIAAYEQFVSAETIKAYA